MRVVQTPSFKKTVKRLKTNQKADLDKAVQEVLGFPGIGQQKLGDLSWLRVFKFRMVGQLVLLSYEVSGPDELTLHDVGSHENFYRDLKAR